MNETDRVRRHPKEVDANRNETDVDEETQKALEDMVSNGSSFRPDVVSSGSNKVKPENPKELESVAEKVIDKIKTV